MIIDVSLNERAFVLVDGVPRKYLEPGQHSFSAWFSTVKVEKVSVTNLFADLDASRLALVPEPDLKVVTLLAHERAVVMRRGRAVQWLSAGTHQLWTVERSVDRKTGAVTPLVEVLVFDTSSVEAPLFNADLAQVNKGKDHVEVLAPEGSVVIRTVDGHFDAVLPAGRHAAWCTQRTVQFAIIDLRERLLHVNGQDVLTRDHVSLRLNVSATFRVSDVKRLATVARAPDDSLYLVMQLVARDAVMSRTLDEVLAARDELAKVMTPLVAARATALGLELVELGIKDLILPGDMKELLNKVIQATKEAEANVILRREETAATRSLAQTAKVLQDNPLLVRLKELEAYKELAGKVGKLNLVMGEASLPSLQVKMK